MWGLCAEKSAGYFCPPPHTPTHPAMPPDGGQRLPTLRNFRCFIAILGCARGAGPLPGRHPGEGRGGATKKKSSASSDSKSSRTVARETNQQSAAIVI